MLSGLDFFMVVLGSVALGIIILITIMGWTVHKSMVKDNCDIWCYGSFSDFQKLLKKFDWDWSGKLNPSWPSSLFTKQKSLTNKTEIHASIISFNNKGLVLYPLSYLRFKFWRYGLKKRRLRKSCKGCKDILKCEVDPEERCLGYMKRQQGNQNWLEEELSA